LRSAPTLPDHVTGTVALRATDDQAWTVLIRQGRLALEPGDTVNPDTSITGSAATLRALATGADSGVDAFLDGRIVVRGNLALSLRMAGLWSDAPGSLTARDVEAHGVRTFAIEAGQGPAVVLLHGLGATNASMLTTFRELARDHRVIAPDLPGFGDSAKPMRSLHAAFYARWLRDFCDVMDLERPHLIGNSMGGRIAVEAGLRHPDTVDRLVLLAPSPAFLRGREYVRLVRILRPELSLIPLPLPRRAVEGAIRRMFAKSSRLDSAWYDAATDEFLRVFSTPRGRMSFFSAMRQIYLEEPHGRRGGFWARLPELTRPALFVWGTHDRLVPAKFAGHVERALPAAKSVVLDHCGHVPQFEQPARTHALVREFLAESA
jgi:pimeloyl-ACP methyl ester carboxylesterase